MASRCYTMNDVYVLQAKNAQPMQQGNSRWVVVNPRTKRMWGAVGKDRFPPLLEVLRAASAPNGCSYSPKYQSIIENGLLTATKYQLDQPSKRYHYTHYYHSFVYDYPFNNYSQPVRFQKDRELMVEYGNIAPPPPVYTKRPLGEDHRIVTLPQPTYYDNLDEEDDIGALATLLGACFKNVDLIDGGDFGPWLRKTSPSGGARHPTEPLISIKDIKGITDGVYRYVPDLHSLIEATGSYRAWLMNSESGITIAFAARVERSMWRYREPRALRPMVIDIGHVIATANELAHKMGRQLLEVEAPALWRCPIDYDEPVFIQYRFKRTNCLTQSLDNTGGPLSSGIDVPQDSRIHLKTNPFVWLTFFNGEIIANLTDATQDGISLKKDEVELLGYTQPSRRGDRPSTIPDLVYRFPSISSERLSELIRFRLLIDVETHRILVKQIGKWISHGWYQSAVIYTSYVDSCSHNDSTHNHALLNIYGDEVLPRSLIKSWQILSTKRHTTRKFDLSTPLLRDDFEQLSLALTTSSILSQHNIDVYQLPLNVDQSIDRQLHRFDPVGETFSPTGKLLNVEDVLHATIGQKPAANSSCVYWLISRAPPERPSEYIRQFIALGTVMQRLCMKAAELDIGVFVTPAVNDAETMILLGLAADDRSIVYLGSIGVKDNGKNT